MGTNYYLERDVCFSCGRSADQLHIGKSSMGWCFSLHVIPEDRINNLDDWVSIWGKGVDRIRNEYGGVVPADEMFRIITERKHVTEWPDGWAVRNGYADEAEFHRRNNSQRGPNGLLRHRIEGSCIAHGSGTWDCITGDFS